MTLHESKPTAYNDPGRTGGRHPFGGAGGSEASGAASALGVTGGPAGYDSALYDSGASPAAYDSGSGPAYDPAAYDSGPPAAAGSNGPDPSASLGGSGSPLGTGGSGSVHPLAGVGATGLASSYGGNGGTASGTSIAGVPGTHHAYLNETPAAIPQTPQPAPGAASSRRPQRALYKHAALGPLRADGDPAAASGDDFFDLLARLAEPEDWGGVPGGPGRAARADGTWVLREYVEWAFERLYQQRRIVTAPNGTHSVFNTGLVTPQQEAVYGLFVPSRDPDGAPWQLQGWYPESERELQDRFAELPPPATYAEEPADLVYDWRRELIVNPRNLLESADNLAALPAPLNSNPYQAGLVLEGAVRRAQARVQRDYRAAVPCWDPAAERVQLMLPLSLTSPDGVDTALVVTRDDTQDAYRGHMLLGLDTAYARARQLGRPRDWLTLAAAS